MKYVMEHEGSTYTTTHLSPMFTYQTKQWWMQWEIGWHLFWEVAKLLRNEILVVNIQNDEKWFTNKNVLFFCCIPLDHPIHKKRHVDTSITSNRKHLCCQIAFNSDVWTNICCHCQFFCQK